MAKVENSQENLAKCFCPNCPTHNDCAKEKKERLYCAAGKTACEFKMNGCLCGACPVHKENNLKFGYYCLNGSAAEVG